MRRWFMLLIVMLGVAATLVWVGRGTFWFVPGDSGGAPPVDTRPTRPPPTPEEIERERIRNAYGSIFGYLEDDSGQPLAGAPVVFKRLEIEFENPTEANGYFSLTHTPVITPVDLLINVPGFEPVVRRDLRIKPGGVLDLGVIRLRRGGRVHGAVTAGGAPLAGAEVFLREGAMTAGGVYPVIRSVMTDPQGNYEIAGVGGGLFTMEFRAPGLATVIKRNLVIAANARTRVDASLEPGVAISGTVRKADGSRIYGVFIGVFSFQDEFTYEEVVSKEDGTFRVDGLKPGAYLIYARRNGFTFQRRVMVQAPSDGLEFVFDVEGAITGTVTTAAGVPVRQFTVRCYREEDKVEQAIVNMKTTPAVELFAPDGAFRIGMLDSGNYTVEVLSPPHATARVTGIAVRAGETTASVHVVMEKGHVVTGRVLSKATRLPIEGAVVRPMDLYLGVDVGESLLQSAVTDSGGFFKIPGIPAGSVTLQANYLNLPPVVKSGIAVGEGAPQVVLEMEVGKSRIQGHVRDAQGMPVPGAWILLQDGEQMGKFGTGMRASTDEQGYYVFDNLTAGPYAVLRLVSLPADVDVRSVQVAEGETQAVNFGEDGEVVLFGAVTQNGSPVTGMTAMLFPAPGNAGLGRMMFGSLNAEGKYRIPGVRPGEYRLVVQNLAGNGKYSCRQAIAIPPEVQEYEVNLAIPARGLRGRVLDEVTGKPVTGAEMVLTLRGTQNVRSMSELVDKGAGRAVTDAAGLFELIGVQPGDYTLRLMAESYAVRYVDVTLPDAEQMMELGDVFLAGQGAIAGVVMNRAGQPLKDVAFFALDSRGVAPKLISFETSDAAGAFRIANLYPDAYTLYAQCNGYVTAVERNIDVIAGQDTARDVALDPGATLRLRVTDSMDNPIGGAEVALVDLATQQPVTRFLRYAELLQPDAAVTDDNGLYWHDSLAPSTYRVYVRWKHPGKPHMPALEKVEVVSVDLSRVTEWTVRLDW